MDTRAALQRMRKLLRHGGTPRAPTQPNIHATPRSRHNRRHPRPPPIHEHWESPAPTRSPPSHTFPEIRALAERLLSGVSVRCHLLWRYSLISDRAVTAHDPSA